MLEARDRRRHAEPERADADANAASVVRRGIRTPCLYPEDTRGFDRGRRIVTALARAPGDDQLDNESPGARAVRRDLRAQRFRIGRRDREPPAARRETLEMVVEPADAAVAGGHRLEQPVAVRETPIGGIHAGPATVHEPKRFQAVRRLEEPPQRCSRNVRLASAAAAAFCDAGLAEALEDDRAVRAPEPER